LVLSQVSCSGYSYPHCGFRTPHFVRSKLLLYPVAVDTFTTGACNNLCRTDVRHRCGTVLDLHQIPRKGILYISTLALGNLGVKSQESLDRKQYNDTIVL